MRQSRLPFLIFILYCIEQYKCGVSCAKLNSVKLPATIKYGNSDTRNEHKDSEYKIRFERELKNTDFNTDSNDLIKHDRTSRGVLGSRRHLRLSDANQITNYFLTGGLAKGHAHFVGASNCDSNNDKTDIVGMSDPTNENDTDTSGNEENLTSTNSSEPIVGIPHIRPLMPLPRVNPIVQPADLLRPITGGLRSLIRPPLHTLPALPQMPMTNILRSVLHPNLHSYIDKLHSMPHTLAKAASLPLQNLLRAQLQLHQILLPTLSPTSLNNAKPSTIPTTDLTHLVGHYSPVVGAPPTSFKSTPTVVDSPQQKDPTSMDNNSNTEENIVSSAKDEEKDANKNEKDGVQNEENNCN